MNGFTHDRRTQRHQPHTTAQSRPGASRYQRQPQAGDQQVDHALRPRSLREMIGQEQLRDKMQILVEAARKRGDAIDHVLLYGPPGLGKTTLSHILAYEKSANLK
jgi:Holliday junction DNA helicase RuvB